MRPYLIAFWLMLVTVVGIGQTITLNPTISPAYFTPATQITVTYDVTGTALANLTSAYAWVWIPANTGAVVKYDVNPATAAQAPAQYTKSMSGGKTLWSITFKPQDFFTSDISTETSMGILLKGTDWSNGQTSDYIASFGFQIRIVSPTQQPLFESAGNHISVEATTPLVADFTLSVNGVAVDMKSGLTDYTYQLIVDGSLSSYTVTISAISGANTSTASFNYYISATSPAIARPAGIIDGINYSADATKATVCLWAPQKTSVYLLGDFNNWQIDPAWIMNKDGEHFWREVTGLTAGTEYGFQYLVEQSVFVADPYADKILDPLDQYINATTYPSLKAYPIGAQHGKDYFNRVSILQTAQTPYTWTATSYKRPAKEKLVIYELLVRDFFAAPNNNYQTLIDTINYFKHLGVNAIELMPITEFSGNDSWGYNPTFMFAPDKAYGTKDKFKEFIDLCHKNGIAVIMDLVMNQQDLPNSYLTMYFDFTKGQPLPNNPWFNVTATHPYSVFYDINHESTYTHKYLDTINYHWLNDYHVDGLRFDLAKGFTQKVTTDVGAWGAYDASRVAILERMADVIWSKQPDAYVILEHFADNSEETVLANYRADEGKGMMLWENFNYSYNQATMGYASGSDFSAIYYKSKGWNSPREVSYMESHDEERLMYNNLKSGNSSGSYNVKTLTTALTRMKAASLLFYTVPGAKMLWQFGELGYDKSINTCTDGTTISNDCRTYDKPVLWSYYSVKERKDLHDYTASLIRMRNSYDIFTVGTPVFYGTTTLIKQIALTHSPLNTSPADSTQMNVQLISNLDLTTQVVPVNFSHTGKWYEYYNSNKVFTVSGATENISLDPGEYRMYTDVAIKAPAAPVVVTGLEEDSPMPLSLFPNPTADILFSESPSEVAALCLRTMQGIKISPVRISDNAWDVHELTPGIYIAEVLIDNKITRLKLIKR